MIAKKRKIEFIESRWQCYNDSKPRTGEVFVGRRNDTVYNMLFLQTEKDIVYLEDTSTHLGCPYDIFTHWLYVGEVQGG